ncbi:DUF3018 family protein [Microbacterium protaetiae]|uniref:DUF3018 family protein n=1 Tax=Microbacterium protaetiae TaxID=2509458 RepID=A0A4P6EEK1_9MICO|nr:antitoxin MazE-like protein [Microbacterium protaetiae]QAY59803.1 DUF3018 family protein [Microbacterium protaetiae]
MSNRVTEYRARMKQRGYKEVRYWVPDLASPEFGRRIREEAAALNAADEREHTAALLDEFQSDVMGER